jgi:hypothetical protein
VPPRVRTARENFFARKKNEGSETRAAALHFDLSKPGVIPLKTAVACGLLLAAVASSRADDPYADSVVSYVSGTGENTSFENPDAALGAPTSSASITAPAFSNAQIVGIGEGGELTLAFDTPILNDPSGHAGGMDFTIFGNEFFVLGKGDITGIFDHTGLTVWVSEDNVTYYELAAPEGADDLFPTEGSGNPALPLDPALTLPDFIGLTQAQALDIYDDSAGGASYSISWAENAEDQPVDLPSISYVKIEGSEGFGYVDSVARVESIPEPGAPVLAAVGAGILLVWRKRRGSSSCVSSSSSTRWRAVGARDLGFLSRSSKPSSSSSRSTRRNEAARRAATRGNPGYNNPPSAPSPG